MNRLEKLTAPKQTITILRMVQTIPTFPADIENISLTFSDGNVFMTGQEIADILADYSAKTFLYVTAPAAEFINAIQLHWLVWQDSYRKMYSALNTAYDLLNTYEKHENSINGIKRDGQENKNTQILDVLRRKFITLTPEEWVRQHFVHFLIEHKGYPASLLANEIQLKCGDKVLRADSVLYSRELQPRMIIEYKAPHIPITQKVFDQISVYNLLLHVDFLVVSNGLEHYICKMDYESKKYVFLETIPDYSDLLTL